jgi:hypothetical protein
VAQNDFTCPGLTVSGEMFDCELGGLGSHINGGSSNIALSFDGTSDDSYVADGVFETTSGGGTFDTISQSADNSARTTLCSIEVLHSDNHAFEVRSNLNICHCYTDDCDQDGIHCEATADAVHCFGNNFDTTNNRNIEIQALDDGLFTCNLCDNPTAGAIVVADNAARDLVVCSNRTDGAITVNPTTSSTEVGNDETGF